MNLPKSFRNNEDLVRNIELTESITNWRRFSSKFRTYRKYFELTNIWFEISNLPKIFRNDENLVWNIELTESISKWRIFGSKYRTYRKYFKMTNIWFEILNLPKAFRNDETFCLKFQRKFLRYNFEKKSSPFRNT